MRSIFKMPTKRVELGRPIQEVNVETFKSAVDTFIENVRIAKPINEQNILAIQRNPPDS